MNIEIIPLKKEYEYFINRFPPVLSNKFLPEWYKQAKINTKGTHWVHETNNNLESPITAKSCPAIQDTVAEGIIIPLWGDLKLYTEPLSEDNADVGGMQYWDMTSRFAVNEDLEPNHLYYHSKQQIDNMPLGLTKDNRLMKIGLPYKIVVPEGYNIYYTDPFYHFRNDIRIMSGIVEADKWGYITFPFSILNDNFTIPAGTPLVQCFIYKRNEEKINLTVRNGNEEEYKNISYEISDVMVTGKNYKTKKY
jgi:hypothetical protein